MRVIAAALKHMLAAGMDHEAIVAAVGEMEDARETVVDPVAEKRRAYDRARKRNSTGIPPETAEIGGTAENPLPRPPSPQTPHPPTPSPGDISTRAREDAAFGRFWANYPRKVGKADARKAFAKAWRKLPPMDEEPILTGGLERAKAAWTDAQYIPHAATWLTGERWQDEPDPITPAPVHERTASRPPDKRRAAFAERLGDIDAAMAAAFEQPRGGH